MEKTRTMSKRAVAVVLAFLFSVAMTVLVLPVEAAEIPQSLRVYAQYWGDPDSAVLLGEYSRSELEALSYGELGYEGYYSNVTRVNTVMRVHARGVMLEPFLLDYVGVDPNSIRQIDFHTTDIDSDARFLSKGRTELFDEPHYYYPHLHEYSHEDKEQKTFVVDDEAAASADAVSVPTLLAVFQYSTKNPSDDLSGEMTSEDTFRLCVGNPDLMTKSSFESARWVDEIYVLLAGTPPEEPTEPIEEPETEPSTIGSGELNPPEPVVTPEEPLPDPPAGPSSAAPEGPTLPQSTTLPAADTPSTTAPSTTAPSTTASSTTLATRRQVRQGTTQRRTTVATVRPTTARTVTTAPNREQETRLMDQTQRASAEKMEQLVVNGYDSLIQWKKESPEGVAPLQKPIVTTRGARNAAVLLLASFAAGAILMTQWFKKEK